MKCDETNIADFTRKLAGQKSRHSQNMHINKKQ